MAHHYVPQVYLRYFSPDQKNIFRYDKNSDEEKLLPIKRIGAINDYYTYLNRLGQKDTSLESPFFSNFEGIYPELITALERNDPLESHRDYMICLIAIMHARVPKQRSHLSGVLQRFHEQAPSLGVYSKNVDLEAMMELVKVYAGTMAQSYFWVGVIQDDSTFITSDNPAGNPFLPLTPKIALFTSQEKGGLEYRGVDQEIVQKINQLTFMNAEKYIFTHKAEHIMPYVKKI